MGMIFSDPGPMMLPDNDQRERMPGTLRRRVLALAFCMLVGASVGLQAQGIRVIDGKEYYSHTVEAGQTLYAIGRSYAVPVDALMAANPEAREGLSIGQVLLIPKDAILKKEARTAPGLEEAGELSHTVARKETLYGISRLYGVDMNVLLERNPELNDGLREGMVVMIPVAKVQGQPEVTVKPAKEEPHTEHVVQPGETLYSLSERYGVPVEEILKSDPTAKDGLKPGSTLRIPVPPGYVPPTPVRADSMPPDRRYRIGLMLPFATLRNDSVLANTPYEASYFEASRIASQFYGGVLIALDSLKEMGLKADVLVVDMGDDQRTWDQALKRTDLHGMDLYLGPFHRSAIEPLARVDPMAHIVCPVPQSNKLILGNPTVSKVTPSRIDLVRRTARYVADHLSNEHVLLLRPDIYSDKELQEMMAKALQEELVKQPGRVRDTLRVAKPGRRDLGDLPGKLRKDRVNVLVVPSDDVEFVTALIPKLRSLAADQRIVVVGMESWLGMETVASSDLDLLGFHFASGSFVDERDPRVVAFTRAFRERFNTDVDAYAFLGFDVTMYYVNALRKFGTTFTEHFSDLRREGLHMGFQLVRTGPENGYRNEYAVMLKQQGLQLVKAP